MKLSFPPALGGSYKLSPSLSSLSFPLPASMRLIYFILAAAVVGWTEGQNEQGRRATFEEIRGLPSYQRGFVQSDVGFGASEFSPLPPFNSGHTARPDSPQGGQARFGSQGGRQNFVSQDRRPEFSFEGGRPPVAEPPPLPSLPPPPARVPLPRPALPPPQKPTLLPSPPREQPTRLPSPQVFRARPTTFQTTPQPPPFRPSPQDTFLQPTPSVPEEFLTQQPPEFPPPPFQNQFFDQIPESSPETERPPQVRVEQSVRVVPQRSRSKRPLVRVRPRLPSFKVEVPEVPEVGNLDPAPQVVRRPLRPSVGPAPGVVSRLHSAPETPKGPEFDPELSRQQAENARYTFESSLDDSITDNSQSRSETRDGLLLTGQYSYSDGYFRRTVHYEADENGYRVVRMEEEPIGSGPMFDPSGRADVSTKIGDNTFQYSITADDISNLSQPRDLSDLIDQRSRRPFSRTEDF